MRHVYSHLLTLGAAVMWVETEVQTRYMLQSVRACILAWWLPARAFVQRFPCHLWWTFLSKAGCLHQEYEPCL
jgi:hypothetical protein